MIQKTENFPLSQSNALTLELIKCIRITQWDIATTSTPKILS